MTLKIAMRKKLEEMRVEAVSGMIKNRKDECL